jgi:hypothetical protein
VLLSRGVAADRIVARWHGCRRHEVCIAIEHAATRRRSKWPSIDRARKTMRVLPKAPQAHTHSSPRLRTSAASVVRASPDPEQCERAAMGGRPLEIRPGIFSVYRLSARNSWATAESRR